MTSSLKEGNLNLRLLLVACLLITSVLTGCSLFGRVQTNTSPINASDLSVKHHFKRPKTIPSACLTKHIKDPQLFQLISVALKDAPDMRSAQARVVRAEELAKQTYATLWPTIGLNGLAQKAYFPIHGTVPPQLRLNIDQLSLGDVGLRFNYELDFWGKNRETLASKINETFAAQMDLAQTRLVLSSGVAMAYFDLQNNIMQQYFAKENAHLLQQLADIVVDRAKQGIESNIPVKTALTDAQTAILSIDDYKRAEMHSRHQLAILMGKNPLATRIETTKFNYNKKELRIPAIIPANLLAQRPDIASARALAESAAHQVNVAKTAFFPNINLKGLLSLQSLYFNRGFNIWFQNDNVGAAFDLPIFDAGARRANLRVNYAQYEMAVNQYNQTILNALKQVSDDLSTLKTLDKQVTAQTQALHHVESNHKLFAAQYKQGIIDYIQMIQIKQLLLQYKAQLFTLQTQQKQTFIALLAALGGEL